MIASSRALVVGGAGQLGRVICARMVDAGWSVVNVDFSEVDGADNILLGRGDAWAAQVAAVAQGLGEEPLGLVVSAAGGWAGGNVGDEGFIESVGQMWTVNLQPAVTAAHLGVQLLCDGGQLVLTGAAAALGPVTGMTGYTLSKAATHHLIGDVAAQFEGEGRGRKAAAVLPAVIDTQTNRDGMPDADTSTWTPPQHIADQIAAFATGAEAAQNGGLYCVETAGGESVWRVAA